MSIKHQFEQYDNFYHRDTRAYIMRWKLLEPGIHQQSESKSKLEKLESL